MKEYLVPSICGRTYLYGRNAGLAVSSRIVSALTMHICPDVLSKALDEAMCRFPQIAVGLAMEGGHYVFTPVNEPVPVFEADSSQVSDFSDPALNGYLFKVSYHHKSIYFDYHRAVTDEYGMMTFVKAVLLRYLELSGYPVSGDGSVKILSDDYLKGEGIDAMVAVDDLPASRPIWFMDARAVLPEVPEGPQEQVAQIRIPIAKLKKGYLDMVNIPVTYIAPLFSHAVHELVADKKETGEYVVASVNVNLRPYFPSLTLIPYGTSVFLAYNRNLAEYPYDTVLMSQKKLLEAQLKSDTLAYSAQRKIADVEKAYSESVSIDVLHERFDEMRRAVASRSTYDIAKIGNVVLPDSMQRLVTELYPVSPAGDRLFSVTVESFRNELVVTVSGRQSVRNVCSRLVELLHDNSIEAYMADMYSFLPMSKYGKE